MRLLIYILLTGALFAQTRAVISDSESGHATNVQTAFVAGYGSEVTTEIRVESLSESMKYAQANSIDLVVRSKEDFDADTAKKYYEDVQLITLAGSNSHIEVYSGDIPTWFVVTGCAVADTNKTGYKVEFIGLDPVADSTSSFANGYVAGQLLYVKDQRGGSWWDARDACAQTGDALTDEDGYGTIDTAAAVAYSGSEDVEPFRIVQDCTLSASRQDSIVTLALSGTNVDKYLIYKDDVLTDSTTNASWLDTLQRAPQRVSYFAIGRNLVDETNYYDTTGYDYISYLRSRRLLVK